MVAHAVLHPLAMERQGAHHQREEFGASVRRRHLADLILVDCACDPSSGIRRAHEIAQSDEEYLARLMTIKGRAVVTQGGAQSQLAPGSVVIWDSTTAAEFVVQEPLVKRSLFVPKAALAEVGTRGLLRTGSVLDKTAPAVQLLSGYLDGLSRTIDGLPLGAVPAARNAAIELLTAAPQNSPMHPLGSLTSVLAAAESRIEGIGRIPICHRHRSRIASMSPLRTLHRAFEGAAESVSGTIRVRRLARGRDDLLAGLSVSQVARRWQYSDASRFSRAVKSHYGHAPSELTKVARESGSGPLGCSRSAS